MRLDKLLKKRLISFYGWFILRPKGIVSLLMHKELYHHSSYLPEKEGLYKFPSKIFRGQVTS